MSTLVFYYDVVCPYAYLASTQIEAVAREAGAELSWRPVLLGGIFRSIGSPDSPAEVMSPPKARLNTLDLVRRAELLGVELAWHPRHPRRTVRAMRLLVGCEEAARPRLTRALYEAYWRDHLDLGDPEVVDAIAVEHGVDPSIADDPAVKQRLFDTTAEAVARGAYGVPLVGLGEQTFFGGDTVHFVREALGLPRRPLVSHNAPQADPVPEGWPLDAGGRSVTVYHDTASPFSYLAQSVLEEVVAEVGGTVEWRPILVGALFNEVGAPMVPLATFSEAKRQAMLRDLGRWAAWWGTPFSWPSTFPQRTVAAQRVQIVEPATRPHLYRAVWSEDRDLGDVAQLTAVLDAAGFDGGALVEATQDPAVKRQLFANTQAAEAAGAPGVPSMVVDGTVVWGQDRLDLVQRLLTGWRPRADR